MTIIGIAGGTGSGKTTVVKQITKVLPKHCAAIVPLDSYYNDTTGMTDEERKAINFDHPDAFDWKLLTADLLVCHLQSSAGNHSCGAQTCHYPRGHHDATL